MGFGSKPQRANLEKKTRIANAVTMIVMNSGSQLSEMSTTSHKLTSHVMSLSWSLYLSFCLSSVFCQVMSPHHSDQMSQRSQVSRVTMSLCF